MLAQNVPATTAPAAWKTVVLDALGFVLVIWSIPAAILLVASPILLVVALVRWIL